jgi:hypothetical protein
MALAGELLSLLASLAQEWGIIAGVGALTVTLVGHLLSLHADKNETVFSYARAARSIRAFALKTIIVSGGAAILVHFQGGTPGVLVAPAFLFKWLLIALLAAFHFVELGVSGVKRDAVEGFEGANWYALFIVHAMAPAVGWGLLFGIYFGWLAAFGAVWAAFVWLMRRHAAPALKPVPGPAPVPALAGLRPVPARLAPNPFPPIAQKPAPAAPPAPAPAAKKAIEVHPNHSLLPMIAELDLPAPQPKVPAPQPENPAPKQEAPKPAPAPAIPSPMQAPKPAAPVELVPESSKPSVPMPDLDAPDLPALHVMPKRPEDIQSSRRGPVVKMGEE